MWHNIVIQLRGQSIREACAYPENFVCSIDGSIYGDRQGRKMAKRIRRDYILFHGTDLVRPQYVKTPMEPFGEEEPLLSLTAAGDGES